MAQGCHTLSLGGAALRRFPPAGHSGASLGQQAPIAVDIETGAIVSAKSVKYHRRTGDQ
jgi:hypothetical protein